MLQKTNNGLVWWLAVQAGLSNLAGAAVLTDVLPERWGAMFLWVVGGLNAATATYVAATNPIATPVAQRSDVTRGA